MKIVSVIEESFMEYEDFVSLVLFSYGCNMKCSYCYNYGFITNPDSIMNDDVYQIIDRHVTKMTDALVFLGGEPTIYGNELFDISTYAKRRYGLSTKIFSNGTNPSLLIDGLERDLFDFVSIDFKSYTPSEHISYGGDWTKYIRGLINFIKWAQEEDYRDRVEVRMTVVPGMEDSYNAIRHICDVYSIRLHKQQDVSGDYRDIGYSVG